MREPEFAENAHSSAASPMAATKAGTAPPGLVVVHR